MRRRGLTLIEVMVSLIMSVFLIGAAGSAYVTGINFEKQMRAHRETSEAKIRFEDRLTKLLRGAYVSANQADTSTYFIGQINGDSMTSAASDELIFTTLSDGFNGALLGSQDDFETMNQNFGPQGGIAEVDLSTTALGEGGQTKQGLFIREQRPADGDPSQGGYESLLSPDVRSIQFEFFDGTDWQPIWGTAGADTTNLTADAATAAATDGRRLPAAVRVTYTLNDDADGVQHVLVIRLPHSDVTALNPVEQGVATP